mmetsp:Transcript_49202/g.154430  ORF Transcript_49202/g.154430 Transcript_49202/m.154430 type:complete len:263 (-) Transcript_49202:1310-2098(-)
MEQPLDESLAPFAPPPYRTAGGDRMLAGPEGLMPVCARAALPPRQRDDKLRTQPVLVSPPEHVHEHRVLVRLENLAQLALLRQVRVLAPDRVVDEAAPDVIGGAEGGEVLPLVTSLLERIRPDASKTLEEVEGASTLGKFLPCLHFSLCRRAGGRVVDGPEVPALLKSDTVLLSMHRPELGSDFLQKLEGRRVLLLQTRHKPPPLALSAGRLRLPEQIFAARSFLVGIVHEWWNALGFAVRVDLLEEVSRAVDNVGMRKGRL